MDATALLGSPTLPPRDWFLDLPEWFWDIQAHDIHIVMDGPEKGRSAAIYYDHDVCWMNDVNECWLPPASPSGNEPFYTGHMPYQDLGRGENVVVGTIPIFGGHTDTDLAYQAAVEYRNDLPERQRIVGTLWDVILPRDPNDPSAGERQVGLFLGAATAEMTVGEAMMVNRSGLSGEWWPRLDFTAVDGTPVSAALDALGPVLVTRAAIPSNRPGHANDPAALGFPVAASYTRHPSGAVTGPTFLEVPMTTTTPAGTKPVAANLEPATACPKCDGPMLEPATPGSPPKVADACCKACEVKDDDHTPDPDDPHGTGDPAVIANQDSAADLAIQVADMNDRLSLLEGWRAQVNAAQLDEPAES